jgi:hydroxymethylbilane synthase
MSTRPRLRLGTRGSPLARWQADHIAACLGTLGIDVEMIHITTQGDVKTGPLGQIGGQGLFTKELQRALLENRIDLAVHSLKDLPTEPVEGLALAAVPERESPGDVLVSIRFASVSALPLRARVGTGSLRRKAQLLHTRSDLVIEEIRGNVETRLRKLDDGEYEAIVLAEAGLKRLGFTDRITQTLPRELMLPAIGQGALGIEARCDDEATLALLAPLNDSATRHAVLAERSLLRTLRGGCLAPVGAWGRIDGSQLKLDAVVLSGDGQQRLLASGSDVPEADEVLGEKVAQQLLDQGAAELISQSRQLGGDIV